MKSLDPAVIRLILNRSVFEEIHQLKSCFITLFSDLANEISTHELLEVHATSQGIKITKGNELQHCPYQVLDIIRDFDKDKGLNIRIMNWWGRGLFIFVFLGKNNDKARDTSRFIFNMDLSGFMLSRTSSPWDYKNMIDGGSLQAIGPALQIDEHLKKLSHIQFVKKLDYPENFLSLKLSLKAHVVQILNFYRE